MSIIRPELQIPRAEAHKLTEHDFLLQIMTKVLSRLIPDFESVQDLGLTFYKRRFVNKNHYQFVIGLQARFRAKAAEQQIDCILGAAADDSKRSAYDNLVYLWDHGFSHGDFQVTEPLCYINGLQALIYRATPGITLFQHICQRPSRQKLQPSFALAAAWLRKLHTTDKPTFVLKNDEDLEHLLSLFKKNLDRYQLHSSSQGSKLQQVIDQFTTLKPVLGPEATQMIYGDFHPENIILPDLGASQLVMIDFTDLGLGNPFRDVGTFIQQFDFMSQMYLPRHDINELKKFFVSQYCQLPFETISTDYLRQINYYQALAATRSSVWLFPGLSRTAALGLLNDAKILLEKVAVGQQSINIR